MDEQPISRGEYSRAVDGLHQRISATEEKLERQIAEGDKTVARHARNNYSQADAELQKQIDSNREAIFGGRGAKGLVVGLAEIATTQSNTEPVLRDLKRSVDSLRVEMAKGVKRSSDSSGGHRAVREAWAQTPGGQKLLWALAALILACASAVGGLVGGMRMSEDSDTQHHAPHEP